MKVATCHLCERESARRVREPIEHTVAWRDRLGQHVDGVSGAGDRPLAAERRPKGGIDGVSGDRLASS